MVIFPPSPAGLARSEMPLHVIADPRHETIPKRSSTAKIENLHFLLIIYSLSLLKSFKIIPRSHEKIQGWKRQGHHGEPIA
jgi:hypothetical protein